MANQGMVMGSLAWVLLYMALMPLDGVLIKHLVNASGLSPWGLVLYNNLCAAVPGLLFSMLLERDVFLRNGLISSLAPMQVLFPVLLSCVASLAISYFQLNVRKIISSTAFMVLGVSNKFLSVLLNQFARLDTNGSALSIGSVLLSISGAILFQQTVTGRGVSQAKSSDESSARSGSVIGYVLVTLAVGAAAAITHFKL